MGDNVILKKAIILNIGTEILKGEIKETNSYFISNILSKMNISVLKIISIADHLKIILKTLHDIAKEKIHYIIISGGIGPTKDDLTRQAISKFLGRKLKFCLKEWEYLNKYQKKNYPKKILYFFSL